MSFPGLPELTQQAWSNAELEQLSWLMAAASQMPSTSLPPSMQGLPSSMSFGNMSAMPSDSMASDIIYNSGTNSNPTSNPTPDGKGGVRYPEPDINALVYDPALGYRFDASTGLHYDANSGLFVNKKLEMLLKYNTATNTYERAGSTADITSPVLANEFAELMGYDTAQTSAPVEVLPPFAFSDLWRSGTRALEAPPPTETPVQSSPPASLEVTGFSSHKNKRSSNYSEMSLRPESHRRETAKKYTTMYIPSPQRDLEKSPSPNRGRASPRGDHSLSPRSGRVRKNSSSHDHSTKGWKKNRSRSRSRSESSISPPRKSKDRRDRSRSRSKDQENKDGSSLFRETLQAIHQIHERNLKNPDNAFSRFSPPTFLNNQQNQLQFIMVTPLPPKGDREWSDLEILFKGILKSNAIPYESVSVMAQDGNAPCDHCIIQFKEPLDAARWYLLHKGALDLANPDGSKCSGYMFFSRLPWKCGNCKELNFPLRFFCYGCYKPQKIQKEMGARAPIILSKSEGFKWVGLKNLDCRITSTQTVLENLPPLDTFDIKNCEYITEENGLPLGLCIFEMGDKPSAKEFHRFLQQLNLHPLFLLVNSTIGLSNNPYCRGKTTHGTKPGWIDSKTQRRIYIKNHPETLRRHQEAQTSLTNVQAIGDYILRSWSVDTKTPNQKGTQTILIYKFL